MATAALSSADAERRVDGRYVLSHAIASGGMAQVYLGRQLGAGGFRRTVAIKRLHPHLAGDAYFMSMLIDEARLAARVRHPNVVSTIDVVASEAELLLVMEYVHGEALSALLHGLRARRERMPLPIVSAIVVGVLLGLHAAHEARDEDGQPLGIVHRDVSPANVLVDVDGVARVVDFGVAKAAGRLQLTRSGQIKGKFAYMAPEQLEGGALDRRADVYAASVVAWECLAGRRLFSGETEADIFRDALRAEVAAPSAIAAEVPATVDAVVMRGLARDPGARFPTARDMAIAIEEAIQPATPLRVAAWLEEVARDALAARGRTLAQLEATMGVAGEASGPQPAASPAPIGPATHTEIAEGLPAGWPTTPPRGSAAPELDLEDPPTVARHLSPDSVRGSAVVVASSPPQTAGQLQLEQALLGLGGPPPALVPEIVAAPAVARASQPSTPAPLSVPVARAEPVARAGVSMVVARWWEIEHHLRTALAELRRTARESNVPWAPVGAALVTIVVGFGALVWIVAARSTSAPSEARRPQAPAAVEPAPLLEEAPAIAPVASVAQEAPVPAPSDPPAAMEPSATAAIDVSALPIVRAPSAHASSRPVPAAAPPKAKHASCDPPWTMGNDGIRHPKPECL